MRWRNWVALTTPCVVARYITVRARGCTPFKHQFMTILERRKALRGTLKAPQRLLEIVKAASRRFGYTDV